MKILIDGNLSDKLASRLEEDFPGTRHVKQLGFAEKLDQAIWDLAKRDGYVILTQDDDFVNLSSLHGPLPKVIDLASGNLTMKQCMSVLRTHATAIQLFGSDPGSGLLVIR